MSLSNASLIKSDVIPVLNILEILTTLEEYTIAIGGVVEGMALEIEQARPAAITGGTGFTPALIAKPLQQHLELQQQISSILFPEQQ